MLKIFISASIAYVVAPLSTQTADATKLSEVSEMSLTNVFSDITPTGSHLPNFVSFFAFATILVKMNGIQ